MPPLVVEVVEEVVERVRRDPTFATAAELAVRTIQAAPMNGFGRRRGEMAPDGHRMILVEMREDMAAALPAGYNAKEQDDFWSRHPDVVAARLVQLANTSGELFASMAWDVAGGRFKRNERAHVQNMRRLFTSLGPAFVKLGQGLASRPDIFSSESVDELSGLFCEVPPFPTSEAMRVITRELGVPWWELFVDLGEYPAAAASLGQVYRGTVRAKGAGGAGLEGREALVEVAVKVQRPNVLETVSCDLFILRRITAAMRGTPLGTGLAGTIDQKSLDMWSAELLSELDYRLEAENAQRFRASLVNEGMRASVTVPRVWQGLSTSRVLTTDWAHGRVLSECDDSEIARVLDVAVHCYATQIYRTGLLHTDPHPGNLIVTEDARLVILDFGQVVEIPKGLQVVMLRAAAHAWHRDYQALCVDLQDLGFIPPGTDVTPLARRCPALMDPWLNGGGAKNFDPEEALEVMIDLQKEFPFISLPPSFRAIGRAVSLLEGIALSSDADYSIAEAMFPMAVERLLTDDSQEMEQVLEYLIYGKGGRDAGVFEAKRVIEVIEALKVTVEAATAEAAARAAAAAAEQRAAQREKEARDVSFFPADRALPGPGASTSTDRPAAVSLAAARRTLPRVPSAAARVDTSVDTSAPPDKNVGASEMDHRGPGFAAWGRAAEAAAKDRGRGPGAVGGALRLLMRSAAAVVAVPVVAATRASEASGAASTSSEATDGTATMRPTMPETATPTTAPTEGPSMAAAQTEMWRARAASAAVHRVHRDDESAPRGSSEAPPSSSSSTAAVAAAAVQSVGALGRGGVDADVARTRDMLRVALRNAFMRRVVVEEIAKGAEAVVRVQLADSADALGLGRLRLPVPSVLFTPFGGASDELLTGVSLAPEVTARDRDVAANTVYLVTYLAAQLSGGGAWSAFGTAAAAASAAVRSPGSVASDATSTASLPSPGQALAWIDAVEVVVSAVADLAPDVGGELRDRLVRAVPGLRGAEVRDDRAARRARE